MENPCPAAVTAEAEYPWDPSEEADTPRLGSNPPCSTGGATTLALTKVGVIQGVESHPVESYRGFSAHTPTGEVVDRVASPVARKLNSPYKRLHVKGMEKF
jgi:hypothetical protein